jgi:hypothetical protein
LPVGESKVTDAGLVHLSGMRQLLYLGLRGNDVSDAGVKRLRGLVNLTGLHLGETKITDACLNDLLPMTKLQRLWLDGTAVSDQGIDTLIRLGTLQELHVADTKITIEGVKRLRRRLPRCRVSSDESPP